MATESLKRECIKNETKNDQFFLFFWLVGAKLWIEMKNVSNDHQRHRNSELLIDAVSVSLKLERRAGSVPLRSTLQNLENSGFLDGAKWTASDYGCSRRSNSILMVSVNTVSLKLESRAGFASLWPCRQNQKNQFFGPSPRRRWLHEPDRRAAAKDTSIAIPQHSTLLCTMGEIRERR